MTTRFDRRRFLFGASGTLLSMPSRVTISLRTTSSGASWGLRPAGSGPVAGAGDQRS